MTLGLRTRLVVVAAMMVVVVLVACGAFLEVVLRRHLEAHVRADLGQKTRCAQAMLDSLGDGGRAAQAAIGWRLAAALDARLTIIGGAGELTYDSTLEDDKAERIASHRGRREVEAALAGSCGTDRRTSHTLAVPMLYAALPLSEAAGGGIVRVALSLAEVEAAIKRLRVIIACAGLVGLGLATFTGGVACHWASRALRRLADHARRVSVGDGGPRLPVALEASRSAAAPRPPRWEHELTAELQRVVSILGRERDQFAAILGSMQEAVLAVDGGGRLTLANGQARLWLGLPCPQVGGDAQSQLAAAPLGVLLAQAGGGTPCRDEFSLAARRVVACAQPLPSGSGAVVVLHDITDLRHLETVRRDFVANVSHELRTPVSVIRANAETLLGGALDDRAAATTFARGLLRSALRLGSIIDDLLAISRAEAGHLALKKSRVAWHATAQRALEGTAAAAAACQTRVEVRGGGRLWLRADPRAFEQVLVNLLDNAIRHGRPGGHVVLSCHASGGQVVSRVADDGPGIPEAHHGRVFERFYRIDRSRHRPRGDACLGMSTGLGLAIVKHYCEAMGGAAGIQAGRRRGTLVWCALPQDRGAEVLAMAHATPEGGRPGSGLPVYAG